MSEIDPDLVSCSRTLTHEQVAGFLRDHPDFFSLCPDLVEEISPPVRWSGESVVDLQRYMVETLRGELAGLRDCAQSVIETSRVNMATQLRTHAAVLALIAAEDIDHLVRVVTGDLPIFLDVDAAALGLEAGEALPQDCTALARLAPGDVARLIGEGNEVLLYRQFDDDCPLFDPAGKAVRSAALARLEPGAPGVSGVLALGAHREDTFHPRQGTELLEFVARVTELCLKRMLPTDR
ncbi:conserved hypothetical protein [uncultured Defluviicoccus sp.]|uniref:DUF484 family protein n=1 Tax=metagenome TaxID=256318 RepID=A0A380TFD3_9ZZZZ|nr:conserved hypothetical protein [uncultured Defluviicoccus sp.]